MASTTNVVDVVVKVDDIVVGCVQSADFTVSREMDPATCTESNGWKEVSPGQKSWSGSFGALFREFTVAEEGTQVSFEDLFDLLDDGVLVTVEYSKKLGGKRYTGQAYISEISYTQAEKGPVTWSANYEGSGAFQVISAI